MDVTCERCATEYEFDETLLSARGTSVKCTNCGHVFKVYPRAHDDADRSTSTWRLQRRDGTIDTLDSLRELQRRIASGELTPQDQIARGDETWKPLGSIPELETFFHAAEAQAPTAPSPSPYPPAAASASDSDAPAGRTPSSQPPRRRPRQPTLLGVVPVPKSGAPPTAPQPVPAPVDAPTSPEPAETLGSTNGSTPPASADPASDTIAADTSVRLPEKSDPPGVVVVPADDSLRLPEPTEDPQPIRADAQPPDDDIVEAEFEEPKRPRGRSTPPPAYFDDDEDIPELPGRGWSPMRWLLIVTVAVAIGVVAANFDQALSLVGLGSSSDAAGNSLGDGDAALGEDHLAAYERALRHYQAALDQNEEDPVVFAKLSNAHALAAQSILDGASPSPGARSRKEHASSALNYAEQALMLDPESLSGRLAEADGLRLTGETKRARESLERARLMPFSRTAEFYRIDALLIGQESGGKLERGLESARQAAESSPEGIRYRLLRARTALAAGDPVGANAEVDAILALAPTHPDALTIAAAIEAKSETQDQPEEAEPAPVAEGSEKSDTEAVAEVAAELEAAAAEMAKESAAEADQKAPAPPKPEASSVKGAQAPKKNTAAAAPEKPRERPAKPRKPASRERTRPEFDEYDRLAQAAGSDAFVDGRPPIRDFGWYMREGEASLAGGDYSKARAYFESALEARPGSGDATDALGRVAYAAGDYELAVRYFRSAAQRGHPDGYYSLGQSYERLGRGDEAVSAYYTYLKRRPSGRHVPEARAAIKRIEPRVKLPEEPKTESTPTTPAPETNTP